MPNVSRRDSTAVAFGDEVSARHTNYLRSSARDLVLFLIGAYVITGFLGPAWLCESSAFDIHPTIALQNLDEDLLPLLSKAADKREK